MTHRMNSRLAGYAFLLYIATGIASMILFARATGGDGAAQQLASMVEHEATVRFTAVLSLLTFLYAVVLGVTLYALTRDQDPHLAMIALCCRVAEGITSVVAAIRTLSLLPVAAAAAAATPDAATATALGGLLLRQGGSGFTISAACFAVGSTLFCFLFLRARSIPAWLAWLGLTASLLLVVVLPAQILGFVGRPMTDLVWIPMALFEVIFALWLIAKGVPSPTGR
jgi:hypothetical protein